MKAFEYYRFITLILICTSFLSINMSAQQMDEKYILNYWIFSSGESNKPIETYRLRDFEFNPPLNQFTSSEGTEFFKNKKVKKYRVKLCGNDYEPNFKEGKWKIYLSKGVKTLIINYSHEVNLFEIVELTKDKLVLKRL